MKGTYVPSWEPAKGIYLSWDVSMSDPAHDNLSGTDTRDRCPRATQALLLPITMACLIFDSL